MRIALIAAVSADGRIAESENHLSLDWTSREDTAFFVEKSTELGVVIMGRNTWKTIGKKLPGRWTVVMTRRRPPEPPPEGVEFTSRSPEGIVRDLSERGYKGIALSGGAEVNSLFLRAGLVDEVFLTVEPILFGDGINLGQGFGTIRMSLVDTRRLGKNTVLLHYRIGRTGLPQGKQ